MIRGHHNISTTSENSPAKDEAPSDRVLRRLRQIIHAVDVQSKKLAKETGLSAPQLIVLKAVQELGEVTTRAVSNHVSLSQPTVTTILDRLEGRDLVERYRSTKDRRIVHTKLTATGRKVLKTSPPLLQNRFVRDFDKLSKKRRNEIISALDHVAQMMGADALDASPVLTVTPPQTAV